MSNGLGPIQEYTPNLELNLVNFDWVTWHDYEHENWRVVDALLASVLTLNRVIGVWKNNINVATGDRYVDIEDGSAWQCLVDHLTPVAPTTFAEDRIANPTRWSATDSVSTVYRGVYANSTSYNQGEYVSEYGEYAIAKTTHVSPATGKIDDDLGNWDILVDIRTELSDAATSAANAATSEANAATSEANAATSETNAGVSEANASSSANDALAAEINAEASAAAALVSEGNAAASVVAAQTAESGAQLAETGAETARDDARDWSSEAENVAVNDGVNPAGFSAFHWSKKAESAAGGIPEAPNDGTPYVRQSAAWADGTAIFAALAHNHDGAYSPIGHNHDGDYDPAGSAASVQSNLDTHEADTGNPHSVTAAQVGSYTQAEVDALVAEAVGYTAIEKVGDFTPNRTDGGGNLLYRIDGRTPATITINSAAAMGFEVGDVITFMETYHAGELIQFAGGINLWSPQDKLPHLYGSDSTCAVVLSYATDNYMYGDLKDA